MVLPVLIATQTGNDTTHCDGANHILADEVHDVAEGGGEDGVGEAVADQHVADLGHAPRARYVALQQM